jgi:hypothetical protein
MSIQDKPLRFYSQIKIQWWHCLLLLIGSLIVIEGIVCLILF